MFTNFTVTSANHKSLEWIFRDGRLTNYQRLRVTHAHPQLTVRCDDSGRVKVFAGERRSTFARAIYRQIAYAPAPEPWRYRHQGFYLKALKRARAAFAEGRRVSLWWYDQHGMDEAQFRAEFLTALDRRISLKVGPPPPWRKLDPSYQTELGRDRRAIEDKVQRRVRLTYLGTPELRARFAHLISPYHLD